MRMLSFFLTFLLMSFSAHAQMSKPQAEIKFKEGFEFYKTGHYPEAIAAWSAIVEGKRENGETYFNLGNAYFKNKNLGSAILNYERALQFLPRDHDVRYNLAYVLEQVKDSDSSQKEGIMRQLINNHIAFYTTGEIVACITILAFLIAIGFLLSLYFKWNGKGFIVLSMALSFILLIFVTGLVVKWNTLRNKAIVIKSSDAKFEPREDATTHYLLNEGSAIEIMTKSEEWLKVRRKDGKLGWIPQAHAGKI